MSAEKAEEKKRTFTPAGANLIVNTLSFLCVLALAATGLFVLEDLKPGESFLGVSRDTWVEAHEHFGMLLIALVVYHLVRHREWLLSILKGRLLGDAAGRKRTLISVAAAAVAFALFVVLQLS